MSSESTIQKRTGRWTEEEKTMFEEALKAHGKDWKQIAKSVRTRSLVQIRSHAQKYFKALEKRVPADTQASTESTGPGSDSPSSSSHPFQKDSLRETLSQLSEPQEPAQPPTINEPQTKLYEAWMYHSIRAAQLFHALQQQQWMAFEGTIPRIFRRDTEQPPENETNRPKQGID